MVSPVVPSRWRKCPKDRLRLCLRCQASSPVSRWRCEKHSACSQNPGLGTTGSQMWSQPQDGFLVQTGLTTHIPEQGKRRLEVTDKRKGHQGLASNNTTALVGEIHHPQQWPQLFLSAPKETDLGSRYQRGPFLRGLLSAL